MSVQVCYKCTDLLDDQILCTGLAPGGLTEVGQDEYRTASFGATLAQEMGLFGIKPEVTVSACPHLLQMMEHMGCFNTFHSLVC